MEGASTYVHPVTTRNPLTGGGVRRAREAAIRGAFTLAALVSVGVLVGIFAVLFLQARESFGGNEGIAQSTLKRYFALLEMLFLVVRVPPWERNPGKRLVKAPKVFLPDSGLLCHFMAATAQSLDAKPGLPGAAVETWVLSELLKHVAFSGQRLSLWRNCHSNRML